MTTNNHESSDRARRYAEHVRDLCRAFHVRLAVSRSMRPDAAHAGELIARPGKKCVTISPVIDETTYAVALHELGHCLHPLGSLHEQGSRTYREAGVESTARDVRLHLEAEAAAWEWAHHYALEWTPAMDAIEKMSLGSYTQYAKRVIGRMK